MKHEKGVCVTSHKLVVSIFGIVFKLQLHNSDQKRML